MTQILSWTVDVVLVLLLVSTLVLALRLDRALRIVGGDRAAFEALVNSLGAATNAVKLGIQTLRSEAERAAHQLEQKSQDADKMATDLSFLIEAADRAGARLEQRLGVAPTTVATTSRLAEVIRELKDVKRYARQKPSVSEYVAEAVATEPPEPSATPCPEPACHAAAPGIADGAPANLRQLAGITTRRRALDQFDPTQPVASEQNRAAPVPHPEAAVEAAHIKLVG